PVLVAGALGSSFERGIVGFKPSKSTYYLYRILNLISLTALMQSVPALVADALGGRGSPKFIKFNRRFLMWLAAVRIGFTYVGSKLKLEESCMKLASFLSLTAAAVFATT